MIKVIYLITEIVLDHEKFSNLNQLNINMKKFLAFLGFIVLAVTPGPSIADHNRRSCAGLKAGGSYYHTDLVGCNLHGQNLYGAKFKSANLSGSTMAYANLTGANLQSADLRSSGLSYAILIDADLRNARISGVSLREANLQGADLSGADLRLSSFKGATLDGITAKNLIGCPDVLPAGWVCENNELRKNWLLQLFQLFQQ